MDYYGHVNCFTAVIQTHYPINNALIPASSTPNIGWKKKPFEIPSLPKPWSPRNWLGWVWWSFQRNDMQVAIHCFSWALDFKLIGGFNPVAKKWLKPHHLEKSSSPNTSVFLRSKKVLFLWGIACFCQWRRTINYWYCKFPALFKLSTLNPQK